MGRQHLPIITTMKAVFIFSTLLCQALGQTLECHPPMPAECGDTDVRCDMGTYGDCWMGDYCAAEGYNCPPTCHIPIPTQCGEGEFACDMGMTAGCQRALSAPLRAILLTLHSVGKVKWPVIWDTMVDVGLETTVSLRTPAVLLYVTLLFLLTVLQERSSVTME